MIYVEKITISPRTKVLNVGDKYRGASAVVCPSNATCKSIRWYSEDSSIAGVTGTTGYIKAIAPGKVKIYAEATDGSGVRNYIGIVVKQPVTDITLNNTNIDINVGATETLVATISPSNATDKSINWTSCDESIATVSSNGIVTGISKGYTEIVASACDGSGIVAYCTVNIKQPVTGITLSHSSIVINVSQTKSLTASVSPTNASNKSISWNSNDNTIATVSNNGVVTGVSAGTTTIAASAKDGSGVFKSCTITVKQPVTDISINASSTEIRTKETTTLEAAISPSNATNKDVRWESCDESIATVSSSGVVTGVARGSVQIIAHACDGSGCTDYITINVLPPTLVNSITLNKTQVTLTKGNYAYITPTVNPENATTKALKWTSDNSAIATVSPGTVTVTITGKGAGTTTIRGTATDGSGVYVTCSVTVLPIRVETIEVSPTRRTLSIGQICYAYAQVCPCDADDRSVTWTSSNPSVATVNSSGKIIARSNGSTTITATTTDRNLTDTCIITVESNDSREKVVIKRDGIGFNKIVFQNSGKEWLCINYDMINDPQELQSNQGDNTFSTLLNRLYANTYATISYEAIMSVDNPKSYSENEQKLLYMIDPHGFAAYVQEFASHQYSNVADVVSFKDLVFRRLFNRSPKYFSRRINGEWYDATSTADNIGIFQKLSESELFFGTHPIYDLTFGLQCFSVVLNILALPVSFSGLAGISVPAGYAAFLKYANLSYTLTNAWIEEDYKTYIKSLISGVIDDEDSSDDTKSAGTNLDWAMDLFKLSDSFEELSEILASRPNYYKDIFEHCAEDNNYRIIFEYNNGTIEEAYSISNRLN